MWQIMQQIDSNPSDTTKATLIFGNVTEADILLRKEFEDLAARKPDQFKVHFVLDKPPPSWSGPSGFINQAILAKALPAPAFGDRIKIFVCAFSRCVRRYGYGADEPGAGGPPPQVESISGGKKSFADQGPLKGVLADLGYTESQVRRFLCGVASVEADTLSVGLQVLKNRIEVADMNANELVHSSPRPRSFVILALSLLLAATELARALRPLRILRPLRSPCLAWGPSDVHLPTELCSRSLSRDRGGQTSKSCQVEATTTKELGPPQLQHPRKSYQKGSILCT